jgi:hypothetical protein
MKKPRVVTLVLLCLATACYAAAHTALGGALVILGVFFEGCMWVSMWAEREAAKAQAERDSERDGST